MEFASDENCKRLDGSLVMAVKPDADYDPLLEKDFPRCIGFTNKTMLSSVSDSFNASNNIEENNTLQMHFKDFNNF